MLDTAGNSEQARQHHLAFSSGQSQHTIFPTFLVQNACRFFSSKKNWWEELDRQLDRKSTDECKYIFLSLTDSFHSDLLKATDHSFYGFISTIKTTWDVGRALKKLVNHPRGYSLKNWEACVVHFPKSLHYFMTKICNFLYTIYDVNKNLAPYLRPQIFLINAGKYPVFRPDFKDTVKVF